MILYLTYWFPAAARGRAIARFMTATAIAGGIGGPISGVLLNLNGIAGLAGWQWLFLIEGIPAIILGFLVFAILPDGPQAARWLTAGEKAWIISRLEEERQAEPDHVSTLALLTLAVWPFIGSILTLSISHQAAKQILQIANGTTRSGR